MTSIRAKINRLFMSTNDKLLLEAEIVEVGKNSGQLVLTDAGRKVVIDAMWRSDEELRATVVEHVRQALEDSEKAEKKAEKKSR